MKKCIKNEPYKGFAGQLVDQAILETFYQPQKPRPGYAEPPAPGPHDRIQCLWLRTSKLTELPLGYPLKSKRFRKCRAAAASTWYTMEGVGRLRMRFSCDLRFCPQCYARKLVKWYRRLERVRRGAGITNYGYHSQWVDCIITNPDDFRKSLAKIRKSLKRRCHRDYVAAFSFCRIYPITINQLPAWAVRWGICGLWAGKPPKDRPLSKHLGNASIVGSRSELGTPEGLMNVMLPMCRMKAIEFFTIASVPARFEQYAQLTKDISEFRGYKLKPAKLE